MNKTKLSIITIYYKNYEYFPPTYYVKAPYILF